MTTFENPTTLSPSDIVDRYLAAWNETDDDARRRLIADIWTVDGSLTDPPVAGTGHDGVDAIVRALQQQYPGHRFRRSSAIDAHHRVMRFAWEFVAPDGTVTLSGLDVGEFTDDGRLARVSGFFGDLADRTDDGGAA